MTTVQQFPNRKVLLLNLSPSPTDMSRGGLLGTVIAVGNFLALSITVSNALDRAAAGDNSVKACMSIQSSSVVRTAILAVIYVLLFHAKVCDPLAALLPLLFAQAAIKLIEFFRKDSKGGDAVP